MSAALCMAAALMATLLFHGTGSAQAQDGADAQHRPPDHPWVEKDFPWFSMTVDTRGLRSGDSGHPQKDIVVRGVVFPLGSDTWAIWDADLLRWAACWRGRTDTPALNLSAMAPLSYAEQGRKAGAGHGAVTDARGETLSLMPVVQGAALPGQPFADPRSSAPDSAEPGRGPLPPATGRWEGLTDHGEYGSVRYRVGTAQFQEIPRGLKSGWARLIQFRGNSRRLRLSICSGPEDDSRRIDIHSDVPGMQRGYDPGSGVHYLTIPSTAVSGHLIVCISQAGDEPVRADGTVYQLDDIPAMMNAAHPRPGWNVDLPGSAVAAGNGNTAAAMSATGFSMPVVPDGMRMVRPSGMDFIDENTAVICTFDGDLWLVRGLSTSSEGKNRDLLWRRVASGLHEPQSVKFHDGRFFVFTRNGLISMKPGADDGRVLHYNNYNYQFTQSAETREFPMDMVVDRHGRFFLAKGGQMASAQGRHNTCVLRIDGPEEPAVVFARGLRQAYLGYNPDADMVTASDQQGNWIPSTPFHRLQDGGFYGFRTGVDKTTEMSPVSEPLCWIPHQVAQSGAGQVHIPLSHGGPLAGKMLYLDYYRSGLVLTYPNDERLPTQAAVTRIPLAIDAPVLKGCVQPGSGSIWLVGFRIWGSASSEWSGLTRVDINQLPSSIPVMARSHREGLLLRFTDPVQSLPDIPASEFSVLQWNYLRSAKYGSGYYRPDGSAGQQQVPVKRFLLSSDRKSLFLETGFLPQVDQIELNYRVDFGSGEPEQGTVWFTVNDPDDFPLEVLGLTDPPSGMIRRVEPASKPDSPKENDTDSISVGRGRQIYQSMGCMACHSIDGTTEGRSGPTLLGVSGNTRVFDDGQSLKADRRYLEESILNPSARIVRGYERGDVGMPSYMGILDKSQIESLVEFINSLKAERP